MLGVLEFKYTEGSMCSGYSNLNILKVACARGTQHTVKVPVCDH